MRKLVAALACRNEGSRLYGKPLQNLDVKRGITILDNILMCLSKYECISTVVLGVAEGNENVPFIDYAKTNDLDFIVGDEADVLSRLIKCGEHAGATDIFRMTSESPFPYLEMSSLCWKNHVESGYDATFLDNIVDGCGFEIIRLESLKKSHRKGGARHRSEFCSLYIRENKEEFEIEYMSPPKNLIRKDIRLTVDHPEDLIVCRAVYEHFCKSSPFVQLADVIEFIDAHPTLKGLIGPFCESGYRTMYL